MLDEDALVSPPWASWRASLRPFFWRRRSGPLPGDKAPTSLLNVNFVRGKSFPRLLEALCFQRLNSNQRPKLAPHSVIKSTSGTFHIKDEVLSCLLLFVLEIPQCCHQNRTYQYLSLLPAPFPQIIPLSQSQCIKFFPLRNDHFPYALLYCRMAINGVSFSLRLPGRLEPNLQTNAMVSMNAFFPGILLYYCNLYILILFFNLFCTILLNVYPICYIKSFVQLGRTYITKHRNNSPFHSLIQLLK